MIAITGGGTGGHLKIAKAIKDELNRRGIKPIYIGSTKGQDREWFENDEGFEERYFLKSKGVVNQKGIKKLLSLKDILISTAEARKILQKHRIKKIFSVGGYSAAPASFAAFQKELFIHEQNAHIGTLNKILKPFCKRFFNTFLYGDPYPVEEIFFKLARNRKELKTIIFLGGSQGAVAINDLALNIAEELTSQNIQIIHQTGKRDFERVKNFYEKAGIKADVFDFSKNLAQKIEKADFAISRAGASTLFELAANRVPTLFIPYPFAAQNHQYHNAKFLSDKNLAYLIKQSEISTPKVLDIIFKADIKTISENLKSVNSENAAKYIVDTILGA